MRNLKEGKVQHKYVQVGFGVAPAHQYLKYICSKYWVYGGSARIMDSVLSLGLLNTSASLHKYRNTLAMFTKKQYVCIHSFSFSSVLGSVCQIHSLLTLRFCFTFRWLYLEQSQVLIFMLPPKLFSPKHSIGVPFVRSHYSLTP